MRSQDQQVVRLLAVAAIVGVGVWHATLTAPGHSAAADPASDIYISSLDWSADGKRLLSLSRGGANARGSLFLHDLSDSIISRRIYAASEMLIFARLASDGQHALIGPARDCLSWIDLDSYETTLLTGKPEALPIWCAAISLDSRCVAAADRKGTIHIFQPGCGPTPSSSFALEDDITIHELQFSADGRRLLSSHRDGSIRIWELETRNKIVKLSGHRPGNYIGASTARFVGDGARVISGGGDDRIRIWKLPGGHETWNVNSGIGATRALAVAGNGTLAAWGGWKNRIIVWNLEHDRKKVEIVSPARAIRDLKFSPDGLSLAVAGLEPAIRIYDVDTGVQQCLVDHSRGPVE